ncbi:MAG TPA: dienelactone hydrolase family protein [Holophagaceae bacterium]|nr:dienelactone hydrolase family protein [Holophagaceae bacterium]
MQMPDGSWIELEVADGTRMRAWLARPEGRAKAPGLLVFQEAFGVNEHIQELCEKFAAEGFVALAPELYHRTAPGRTFPYDDMPAVKAQMGLMTLETIEADVKACGAWFAQDRQAGGNGLGAIGYCMGGRMAYLANTMLPLACAASYYGGMMHTFADRAPKLSGPHLFCWGGLDATLTWEQRPVLVEALRAAKKPFLELVISDAHHGFNCDMRPQVYSGAAARQARALTLAFLHEHLG